MTPEGRDLRAYATGIRNCVGLAVAPGTGDLWCATNERDGLGDDLVPDYVTRVREGGYYGWPWFYLGNHEEPRLAGQRPDLAGKAIVPDVLLQSHSAALGLVFSTTHDVPARLSRQRVRRAAWVVEPERSYGLQGRSCSRHRRRPVGRI